ncbi:MAG: hemin receptor [Proteobacteria bacterium]|nr:hemin receptor [Pseudomonadota bacterium]
MNEQQIQLVQETFARARRLGPHVAATFYAELMTIDPSIRAMFKGDMVVQGEKLMNMLGAVVDGLRAPQSILPTACALAVKHLDYGVEAKHYAMVGTALLRTLKHELGQNFTQEMREAWGAAYQFLADAMIAAAYGSTARPSAGPAA